MSEIPPRPPIKPPKPPVKKPPGEAGQGGELCAEMSGFLFQHPCAMFARWQCFRCGKPVCNQHSVMADDDQMACLSCSQLQPGQEPDRQWQDSTWWDDVDVDFDSDHRPIWYSKSKRLKRRNIDREFTDADEGIFEQDNEGASARWENDMGAS